MKDRKLAERRPVFDMIALIRAEDLAKEWGFAGVTNSFRTMCAKLGVRPVRPGWFDPRHVRQRMDAAQSINPPSSAAGPAPSLVELRRARNGQG